MIYCQNEYGQAAYQVVYGVEILNSGAGMSVDDITSEVQFTFVAQSLSPMTTLGHATEYKNNTELWDRAQQSLSSVSVGDRYLDANGVLQPVQEETLTLAGLHNRPSLATSQR